MKHFILNFLSNIYKKKRLILIFIFCFSILISLSYLVFLENIGPKGHKVPGSDYLNYYAPVAENISHGKGVFIKEIMTKNGPKKIVEGEKVPAAKYISFKYPIGYPLILSGLFHISNLTKIKKIEIIKFFNVVVSAFTCIFLFLIAESIFGKRIALISSFLWMSYPFNLWFIKNPNTEVPFMFLLYLAIWIYILARKKRSIILIGISGILIALSSLIRPIVIFLPIVLVIFLFFFLKEGIRRKILFSLIFLTSYIIVILPWEIYIFLETNRFVLLSTNGPPSIVDGLTFDLKPGSGGNRITCPKDILLLMERAKTSRLDSVFKVFCFLSNELISKPVPLIELIGCKMARSWYATSQMWWEKKILLVQIFYLIPAFGGIAVWFKNFREKKIYLIFFLLVIAYFWGMTVVALSILRYMVPIMGLVIIFSAIALDVIVDKLAKKFSYSL